MRPFAFTERVGDVSATVEADSAEELAKLAGLPRPFVVPPGHVLKVVVELDEAVPEDMRQELTAIAAKWATDPATAALVIPGGTVRVLAVPASCPDCGSPKRDATVVKAGTFGQPKDPDAAGERMAAQRAATPSGLFVTPRATPEEVAALKAEIEKMPIGRLLVLGADGVAFADSPDAPHNRTIKATTHDPKTWTCPGCGQTGRHSQQCSFIADSWEKALAGLSPEERVLIDARSGSPDAPHVVGGGLQ